MRADQPAAPGITARIVDQYLHDLLDLGCSVSIMACVEYDGDGVGTRGYRLLVARQRAAGEKPRDDGKPDKTILFRATVREALGELRQLMKTHVATLAAEVEAEARAKKLDLF